MANSQKSHDHMTIIHLPDHYDAPFVVIQFFIFPMLLQRWRFFVVLILRKSIGRHYYVTFREREREFLHIVHIYRCPLMSIRGGQRLVILIIKLPHFFSIKLSIKHFILRIPYEEFLHENPCYHYSVFHKIKTGFFNTHTLISFWQVFYY